MKIKFEIKYKDAAGKVGKIKLNGKTIETPYLFPVINPFKQELPIKEIKKMGFNAIITNAYILFKRKEEVMEKGIHNFLGFDGIIETDSGAYQLLQYGDIDIENEDIIYFQNEIGVDIGNILDIPSYGKTYEEAKKDLEITLERLKQAIEMANFAINGPIQGDKYLDLRYKALEEVSKLDIDIYAIGGIVPYMNQYKIESLAKIIGPLLLDIPRDRPVHLFGLGHPLIMPLFVALGADLFDSASYSLFAKEERILTPFRTFRLEDLTDSYILDYKASELKGMENKTYIIAKHNLLVLRNEINFIRDLIRQNRLWDYVIIKAHAHPSIYFATKYVLENLYEKLKEHEPITKRVGILYQGELTELRSDLRYAIEQLKKLDKSQINDILDYAWPFGQFEIGEKDKKLFFQRFLK
uniref:tRNA-guanine(15) transglycosylase n=1 Tax=Nanoarchaeum equitans (strain Kin4-M) TaxID=228908 RepID=ATGT_NANEQ|nr:RecName: Full=tRNA-guanine(15) transglycosylase; AltName: Full=7-cyano-7-deazaguanine tRNA-ribosyltransferase; AltName: Full=Archaeal tRNA-guanine transglycosylase [Nanoarchaeum equitans Kin4-M]